MSRRLILIRHGETDWSGQRRYCGFSDIPLNEKGREQAQRLKRRLRRERIQHIYSSDMKRATEFAQLVFPGQPIERLGALREINFGLFEGLSFPQVQDKYPQAYRKWVDNPLQSTLRRGESVKELAQRVRRAWNRILSADSRITAVVTHAGPIKVILGEVLKMGLKDVWQIEQNLAALNIVEIAHGRCDIRQFNYTGYLDG